MHKVQELVRLHRMGTGVREVARLLGISPNTERLWRLELGRVGLLDGPADELPDVAVLQAAIPTRRPPQQESTVESVSGRVEEWRQRGMRPRAIYDRLRLEEPTFKGSYWAVKRLWARLQHAAPVEADDVAIPVETRPGQVAQVDFGYAGRLVDPATGLQRRAWVFVMVLAHSRHLFAKLVFDQTASTWQQLHVAAFAWFGGVPDTIVPDNLKAAVVRVAFGLGNEPGLNKSYRELARHYGFKVDPAPPRAPQKKGKVERSIRYVRHNGLAGLPDTLDIRDGNQHLARWCREIAGMRVHGTTQRRPLQAFEEEEKAALLPVPGQAFVPVVWREARVHRDAHVAFEKRLYSVPWRHIGATAWVRATPESVRIYVDDVRVAEHDRRGPGVRSTVDAHLPDHRRDLRHRGQSYWVERALRIGPQCEGLVVEIFANADVLSPLRKVQAIVAHLERYPAERAENAARRARHFAVHEYRGVRDILDKALDLEPLPPALQLRPASAFRFTRPIADMLDRHQEKNHGYS